MKYMLLLLPLLFCSSLLAQTEKYLGGRFHLAISESGNSGNNNTSALGSQENTLFGVSFSPYFLFGRSEAKDRAFGVGLQYEYSNSQSRSETDERWSKSSAFGLNTFWRLFFTEAAKPLQVFFAPGLVLNYGRGKNFAQNQIRDNVSFVSAALFGQIGGSYRVNQRLVLVANLFGINYSYRMIFRENVDGFNYSHNLSLLFRPNSFSFGAEFRL